MENILLLGTSFFIHIFYLVHEIRSQQEWNSTHYVLVTGEEEILKYNFMGILF